MKHILSSNTSDQRDKNGKENAIELQALALQPMALFCSSSDGLHIHAVHH